MSKAMKILLAVVATLTLEYTVGTYVVIPNLPAKYHFHQDGK